jgi:mannobiose 2-epimerase
VDKTKLEIYGKEVVAELRNNILPFWMNNVIDYKSGGFLGAINGDGTPDPAADKGAIMAARILWTFSRAYIKFKDEKYRKAAELMNGYVMDYFIDKEYGGVYWMLDSAGKPLDTVKKFYAQGFMLFGLAEFSKASGDKKALAEARELFALCEKYGRDKKNGGYIDALGRGWEKIDDMRLSSKELNAPKSMNINLHIMEAFAVLDMYHRDSKVTKALEDIVRVFISKIIQPNHHFDLFFDMEWNSQADIISYGHDIEGSWLITEAAHIAGNKALIKEAEAAGISLAEEILLHGIDNDGGLLNEGDSNGPHNGPHDRGKEWWMQAEAMVGFLNAYEITGREIYLDKSMSAWEYVKKYVIRPQGEWYFLINKDGTPDVSQQLAGQWKCPYHNGRACMEVYERISKLLNNTHT